MYVGMARITLVIAHAHSLKEKRMVLRRIRDRVRERAHVTINEVGAQDVWQRAELGCAVASGDRQQALELLDVVVKIVAGCEGAEISGIAKDATTFDKSVDAVAIKPATDDDQWIPDEWKAEL